MSLTISAPAKIYLLGEHSVVYTKPALLAAINKRLFISVESAPKLELISEYNTDYLQYIINLFEKTFQKKVAGAKITIRSEIPIGRHIGSSAALSVATIGALMRFFLKIWDPKRINELSYEAEKEKHGNPSGADNTTCCFGGLVWYRKEVEFLKSIWNLPVSTYQIPRFILIDTGLPKESTKEMVQYVNNIYNKKRKYIENILSDQEEQTKRILVSLKNGDREELKKAIIIGERNLEKMGVVSASSKKIIREIEKVGGCAKICGGGGTKGPTGFLLAYHKDPYILLNFAKEIKLDAMITKLGEEGVRVEK